jgi:uncharacterized protein YrrD
MQFKAGMDVFLWDGTQVGRVDRIVIDPVTAQVTDLVVHKGFFFKEDRVVPVDAVVSTDEGAVVLEQRWTVDSLSHFEESSYVTVDDETRARGQLPGDSVLWVTPMGGGPDAVTVPKEGGALHHETQNIPEGTVAVEVGSPVLGVDGAHLGRVEEVIVDANTERMTHIVVERGLVSRERRLIPTEWVDVLTEREVRLAVAAEAVDQLPLYEP